MPGDMQERGVNTVIRTITRTTIARTVTTGYICWVLTKIFLAKENKTMLPSVTALGKRPILMRKIIEL